MSFGAVVRVCAFIASLMVIFNGAYYIFSSSDNFKLHWNDSHYFFTDTNLAWRRTFPLDLSTFCSTWGPLFLGFLGLFIHWRGLRWGPISNSWLQLGAFFLFTGFFGAFGYCGNMGILTGSACCLVTVFAWIAICAAKGEPTHLSMDHYVALGNEHD
eukprot:gnl/Spiro4/23483_TR11606_c0_g1_i1.p1 gnl/Spiro4/23483_TR11606_c0_g1~~gnl/Spiro4/23483_TR11606_c0_g1_i1.p1  ORF type:complete len:169 (+),score=19.52 gnl/Spiro4/23483_TR11606_c0_g1_i1:39-509(+)